MLKQKTTIMKVCTFLILLISPFLNFSQEDGKYDDLVILFADGKYEKVISSAEKYAKKEANKKDAEPYVWMAKGFYKISISGNSDPIYKNAYKDATKSLMKAFKLDKDSLSIKKNEEFISVFQESLKERMLNDLSSDDLKKAGGWAQSYSKLTYNDLGPNLFIAAMKYRAGDKSGSKALFDKCEGQLIILNSLNNWSEADVVFLKHGAIQAAESFIAARQLDKARKILEVLKVYFDEDEEFILRYKEVLN